tara:strand:- start:90 stop:353 length:264 start_codon:yes stop_codon:yes gene_type:complete
MSIFGWLSDMFSGYTETGVSDMSSSVNNNEVNPATGLPMVHGTSSGVDIAGNHYGTSHDGWSGGMGNDNFSDSMGNDSFGGGGFDNW